MTRNPKDEILNPKQYQMNEIQMTKNDFEFRFLNLFRA